MTKPLDLQKTATQPAFAALVGISQQGVSELLKGNVLTAGGSIGEWLLAYCANLREVAAGRASERDSGVADAKRRLTSAQADVAEMEASELAGDLIRRAAVVERWGKMTTSFRARMLVIPPTLAPRIAPPGKAAEVQQGLTKAIHEALTELVDG